MQRKKGFDFMSIHVHIFFFEGEKSKSRREGAEYTSFALFNFNFITVREGEKPYMLVWFDMPLMHIAKR